MIKTAICSYGYSTKVFHAPAILALPQYFNLSAFVERHNRNSQQAFSSAKIYQSCEELCADPSIDLIVVNTPNNTHFNYARKALLAGKHVVVDKPFAASLQEGQELIDLANKRNRVLSVFHNRRWEGELLAVKNIVNQGLLGRILEVEFKFERYRLGLNPKIHKEEPTAANGIVYELGTHLIDQALFIFGLPQSVYAEIYQQRDGSKVDDYCSITLYYPDNMKVVLKTSLLVAHQGAAYTLHGSKGSFTKHRANVQETQLSQGMSPSDKNFAVESAEFYGKLTLVDSDGKIQSQAYPSPQSSYIGFYNQLGEAITTGAALPVNPIDALNGLRIIEAAYKSAKQRTVIDL